MALVLHKGKPYSPPTIHGYAFSCLAADGEFPGPETLWGSEVEEKDFHKFLLGVEGSPFFLKDESVVIPPPPLPAAVVAPVAVAPIPGAVPTADAEAAAALQRSAIASGALEPLAPPPPPQVPTTDTLPEGGQESLPPAGEGADQTGGEGEGEDIAPPTPEELADTHFAQFALANNKTTLCTMAQQVLGLSLNPGEKRADLVQAIKEEIARRVAAGELSAPENTQA